MRRNPRLFRLTASVALSALLWDSVAPTAGLAQPAPPPLPQPYSTQPYRPQINQFQGDPPARVGRIAHITGTVSFHNEGDTQWSPASVNYPVSTGNTFWTEPAATTELEISDSRIVLAGATEFDIATLDGNGLQAVAAQGEAYVHLRDPSAAETWSVQTPRGLVRLGTAGRYDIVVGSTEQPTLVTVVDGAAEIEGPGVSLRVSSGQTATISGTESFQGSVGPALRDPFLTARLDAERPRPAPPAQIPAQVGVMPGGSDLAGYGNWAPEPTYGQVWYPPVSRDWVPYREGRWAYIGPWGWTWIDDAPWGFAPFHYGRWIEIGGRWAWTPGGYAVAAPPVYAPALVAFIGLGAGVALGAALAARSIGWVPLGPREAFRPWYRASNRYVREVNVHHVTTINTTVAINTYVNRRAATSISGSAMAASRPVQSVVQPLTPQQFANARPIVGQQPMRPTAATSGVTQAVARQLNFGPTAPLRSAPGPAVRPLGIGAAGPGFAGSGAGFPGRPALGNPALHAVDASPPIRPSGAPPLAPPGSRPADVAVPQAGRPIHSPPTAGRAPDPGVAAPAGVGPVVMPATPVQVPHADPRGLPQVITPSRPEPQHFAPQVAMPRVEPQHLAPPVAMPRVEPQHFAPPVAMPRVEPQHFAPPVAMPRVEPQHFAPPAPRPEPPHPPAPAPVAREKRPGER